MSLMVDLQSNNVVFVTPHIAGVINKFNEYRAISESSQVVACSFDIEGVMTDQAWMLAVYFADVLRGRV